MASLDGPWQDGRIKALELELLPGDASRIREARSICRLSGGNVAICSQPSECCFQVESVAAPEKAQTPNSGERASMV